MDYPQQTRFTNIDQILVRASTTEEIPLAIRQITDLLHERHHIKTGQPDDFSVRDMTEMAKALGSTTATMTRSLLFVALVSLIVGGVGIMNIMLVSVTERTREIGLRMAVGARPRDILRQFLVEAVVLCLMGGFMGIVLGRGAADAGALTSELAHRGLHHGHRGGHLGLRRRRHYLRLLPGLEGVAAGSHRSSTL